MAIADRILWLDLETTGNRPHDDIIEIGAVMTDISLRALGTFEATYRTHLTLDDLGDTVARMHVGNGLWEAVTMSPRFAEDGEQRVLDFVREFVSPRDVVPLGGSGVSHFDRRYIDRTWPRVSRALTYWAYDIGSVRRFARLAGIYPPIQGAKSHRAMDDVLSHIEEARWFLSHWGGR